AARRAMLPGGEHRESRSLNNPWEHSHRPTRQRARRMQGFITRPCATVSRRVRSSGPALPTAAASALSVRIPLRDEQPMRALGRHNRHGAGRLKGEGGPGRDTRSLEERLSLNNVTQPSCTWPPLATTRSVCGTAPRGSLGLIGELLPTNGGFHHHPTD